MRQWWVRPAVRLGAALLLPVAVPLIITLLIWALPGDPASIICPPESCGGTELLAERWHLDEGPMGFFGHWLGNALQGDLGQSWRFIQGESVAVLIEEAVPTTLLLIALAFVWTWVLRLYRFVLCFPVGLCRRQRTKRRRQRGV